MPPNFAIPAAFSRHPARADAVPRHAASDNEGGHGEGYTWKRKISRSETAGGDGGGHAAAAGLGVALALALSLPAQSLAAEGMPGSGPGCSTTTNPSYSMVSCERTGLDRNGRLLGCRWVGSVTFFGAAEDILIPPVLWGSRCCYSFQERVREKGKPATCSRTRTETQHCVRCVDASSKVASRVLHNRHGCPVVGLVACRDTSTSHVA